MLDFRCRILASSLQLEDRTEQFRFAMDPMTKKRDAKRQAILDTAYQFFRTQGFDQTSVSEITAKVGGSKATIYSHFPSKEELFVECMMAATEAYIEEIVTLFDASGSDPNIVLREYAARVLSFTCSPDIVAVRRLLIAEANRFGIGKLFYAKITVLRAQVAALLARFMATGALRPEDPRLAADYLRALLEAELVEPLLLHARETPDEKEIKLAADRAITVFLQVYAPTAIESSKY
jgi:AcrR family transcriptional regulator